MIGKSDQAHHQDDLKEFWAAVDSGNIPAVSDLKAVRAEDGRAHNSSPLDEQRFLVETINRLERTSEWDSTAVAILWDHSDGWSRGPPVPRSSDGRARLTSETRAVYPQFTPR
jgi:phospholipase C